MNEPTRKMNNLAVAEALRRMTKAGGPTSTEIHTGEWKEILLAGAAAIVREEASRLALQNVLTLARQMKRRAQLGGVGCTEADAASLIRFCAAAGVKPEILR